MLEAHKEIIRGRAVVADDWQVLRLAADDTADTVVVPEGKIIVPLGVWLAQQDLLAVRADKGVWLAPDERHELLAGIADQFAVIAIDFPKFNDGRGYSIAFNVRRRLGFTGELRAIGDVLRDQLFSMSRVGFNAYAPRADRSIHDALKGLTVFSETYQASVDQPLPLFRRTQRDVQAAPLDLGAGI